MRLDPFRHAGLRLTVAWCLAAMNLLAAAETAAPAGVSTPSRAEQIRRSLDAGRYREAEGDARALLASLEEQGQAEGLDTARGIDLLVEALLGEGRWIDPSTRALADRAVAMKENLLGQDAVEVAVSLDLLARLILAAGRPAEASAQFDRALRIRDAALGPDHPDLAQTLTPYAYGLLLGGRFAEAKALLEKALRLRESALPSDDPAIAETVTVVGHLHQLSGAYAEAASCYGRSLGIMERARGVNHPEVANILNATSELYRKMGRYAEARLLQERSIRILEAAHRGDHPLLARSLSNLALLLTYTQEWPEARALYERALRMREKSLGPDHPGVAETLNNIALLLGSLGEYAEATPLLERALKIHEDTYGRDAPITAMSINNLASNLSHVGHRGEALALFARAVDLKIRRLGPDHPAVATSLIGLARMYEETGELDVAKPLRQRVLEIDERSLGDDHPLTGGALKDLANLEWRLGATAEARRLAVRAARNEALYLSDVLGVLPERQALKLATSTVEAQPILFSGLAVEGDDRNEWLLACWEWALSRQNIVLDELVARRRSAQHRESAAARRAWTRLVAARTRLADLWLGGVKETPASRIASDLAAARLEKEDAERALARASARFRHTREGEHVSVRDLAKAIPAGGALVDVVQATLLAPRAGSGELHFVALVLGRDGRMDGVDLGLADRIDDLVAEWRNALAASFAAIEGGNESENVLGAPDDAGRRLREAIWDPVLRLLRGATTVFLVAEGRLHEVDVAALPARGGGYLVERGPAVHRLDSGRDLTRLRRGGSRRGRGVLVIGDPEFDTAAASPTVRVQTPRCAIAPPGGLHRLPHARAEIDAIAALFGGREEVIRATGRDASEATFARTAPGRRVIHVATHAFFLEKDCLSGEDPTGVENPLLRSGLILSPPPSSDPNLGHGDGLLTAEEIAGLDLEGVDLAVLSACDTGRGDVRAGEGVFGLRRAFAGAGARTVVMTLWPVPDLSARRWMTSFYQSLASGRPVVEAVRGASLDLLEAIRAEGRPPHPYLWAGFVAAGDWRSSPRFP